MDEATWDAEDRLWRRILHEANVGLTPGSACHIGEPGFMRICFATESSEIVTLAIERVAKLLHELRHEIPAAIHGASSAAGSKVALEVARTLTVPRPGRSMRRSTTTVTVRFLQDRSMGHTHRTRLV